MSNLASGSKGLKLDDFSHMALVISVPHISASTLSLFITNQFIPGNVSEDILKVLDFTLTTFPLTLAVTLLVSFALDKDLKFFEAVIIIIIAGLMANLLSMIIPSVHHTDNMAENFTDSTREAKGPLIFILFAYKLITIWWRDFGPIMFVQSVLIGAFFGYRLRLTKTIRDQPTSKKNITAPKQLPQQKKPPPLPISPPKKEPPPLH